MQTLWCFLLLAGVVFANTPETGKCAEIPDSVCTIHAIDVNPCKNPKLCLFRKGKDASIFVDFTPKYCHYITPSKFLVEMDMATIDVGANMALVLSTTLLMHILTCCILWYRLNKR